MSPSVLLGLCTTQLNFLMRDKYCREDCKVLVAENKDKAQLLDCAAGLSSTTGLGHSDRTSGRVIFIPLL